MNEPDDLGADARRVLNALEGSVVRALRRQDRLAVAVSGGLDSSVLAALFDRHADIDLTLVTVATPQSTDALRARHLARHLKRPLVEVVATPKLVVEALPRLVPLVGRTPVDPDRAAEWNVPEGTQLVSPVRAGPALALFLAGAEAQRFARRLVVGQGADELFGGYRRFVGLEGAALEEALGRDRAILERDVLPAESRIAKALGVEFHYPYLDPAVEREAARVPPAHKVREGERKVVLREVARLVGLGEEFVQVPKTAAQYGSGIADVLKRLADEAGLHQNEYLTRFLSPDGRPGLESV